MEAKQTTRKSFPGISRRSLIQSSAAAAALIMGEALSAHAAQTPAVAPQHEAPMLAELVKSGKLPTLADRMPASPAVVKPMESVGKYGGTIRRAQVVAEDATGITALSRSSLAEWSIGSDLIATPGIAESWDISADGTTYLFHLRKGIRWSDGESFTSADIVFWYEAIAKNPDLTAAFPIWLQTDGKPVDISAVDESTVQFKFTAANGLLPRSLSFPGQGIGIIVPKHYLSQFHPNYADKAALDAAVKKSGFQTWKEFFLAKNSIWTNPDRPVMGAWKITQAVSGGTTRAIAERNPYYWKVDTDGNQLPYVDKLTFDVLDKSAITLRAANGEIDMQYKFLGFQDMPILQDGSAKGNYTVDQWHPDAPWIAMYMNQSHKDPVMRKLMQNVDFRAGLSHAINRDEMNQLLYLGLGGTQQPCAVPQDPYFVEGYGKRFTEFNTDTANQLLDKAGLDKRGSDGIRLRPDGKPITLTILTFQFETGVNASDGYELVKKYWDAVGVKTVLDIIDSPLWQERVQASDHDIAGYTVAGLLWDIDPLWYVPTAPQTYWAPLFGIWNASQGKEGEQPPELIQKLIELQRNMVTTTDDATRLDLGRQILGMHDENVWMIGTVTTPFQPTVVNNNLGNVVAEAVGSWRAGHEQIAYFEQIYYKNS